jgi:hypothetical protein
MRVQLVQVVADDWQYQAEPRKGKKPKGRHYRPRSSLAPWIQQGGQPAAFLRVVLEKPAVRFDHDIGEPGLC